jgi:transcriptional regulator with XRE-family HTH domain
MEQVLTRTDELGHFLRTRRARLTPDDVGLAAYGARRVPGLRREELAMLAGVSVTYYTRLEQGQSVNASASVIDAIGRALGLDEDERAHLHDLAKPSGGRGRRPRRPARLRPGIKTLIEAMSGVPALALAPSTDVLAWNRLGHALVAGHVALDAPDQVGTRPNLTRMLFLDPHTRELYADWDEEARRAVASLRLVAGRFPDDRALAELVGELSIASPVFAALWARHPVHNCTSGTKRLDHPEVGHLELGFEVLHLPDDPAVRLLTYSAATGPARNSVELLAHLVGQRARS